METWRGFWRLNAHSRRVVVEAAVALVTTSIGLRLAGFRRWKNLLVRAIPRQTDRANAIEPAITDSAYAITRLEQAAARHLFFQPNCLEQSLALCWLLQRRGIPAELRIGARKQEGRFEAHAWVELDGLVLNEGTTAHLHFVPFKGSLASTMERQTH